MHLLEFSAISLSSFCIKALKVVVSIVRYMTCASSHAPQPASSAKSLCDDALRFLKTRAGQGWNKKVTFRVEVLALRLERTGERSVHCLSFCEWTTAEILYSQFMATRDERLPRMLLNV